MALRPYQIDALEASRTALLSGTWSQVLILPTGAGKTYVFAHLPLALRDWLDQFPRARMLILAHREELLEQAANHLREINPSLSVGIEQGSYRSGPFDDVVIASVQTLTAAGGRRLKNLNPDEFRIIVVDECHHTPSVTYQKILRHFGALPPDGLRPNKESYQNPEALAATRLACQQWWQSAPAERLLLGVTATPDRSDGIGLEWSFQAVTYAKDLRWMVEAGYLVPPRALLVDTRTNLDAVHTVAGDFNQGELAEAVNTPERNALAVAAWKARARNRLGFIRPSLAFTVDVEHAKCVAAAFQAAGVKADWASGENRSAVADLKAGKLDVLASCNLVTEGFDYPPAGIALMLRPTKSRTLYTQCVGRILRLAENKVDALIIDIADITRKHALVSAGDLFGLPERFDAEGKNLIAAVARIEAIQQQLPQVDLSTAHSLVEIEKRLTKIDLWTVRESPTVQKLARLTWIEDSVTHYHLPIPRAAADGAIASKYSDRLDLAQNLLGEWESVLVDGETRAMTTIARSPDLPSAFRAAELWVRTVRPDVSRMKDKDAFWRSRKASPKQIALLQKYGAQVNYHTLTRGAASTLLDQHRAAKSLTGVKV